MIPSLIFKVKATFTQSVSLVKLVFLKLFIIFISFLMFDKNRLLLIYLEPLLKQNFVETMNRLINK